MQQLLQRKNELLQLLKGELKPSDVVGKGYKYPKSVASAWLRTEIHNLSNPNNKVSDIYVQTNGKPYASEERAKQSEAYLQLEKGTFRLLSDNYVVSEFGVLPASQDGSEKGYCIYIKTQFVKSKSA